LTTTHSPSPTELTAGLKLIADSIAQQRQYASRALIFSPLVLSAYVLLLSLIWSRMVQGRGNLPVFFTTAAGVTMAFLVAVRKVVAPYIDEAEKLGVGWLVNEDAEGPAGKKGKIDEVVVTKFGDEVIGVAVWRILGSGPASSGGGGGRGSSKEKTAAAKADTPQAAVVRGWTVRLKYRHKGVGRALLEEVVSTARAQCGTGVEIKFDDDFAGKKRLLPQMFNRGFDRREGDAKKMLAAVVSSP
jgi:hypothetical protein